MTLFETFANQAIKSGRFAPLDKIYVQNKARALVGDEDVAVDPDENPVDQLVNLAVQRGKINDGQTEREILSDQLYDLLTPTPAVVNHRFWNEYLKSPEDATNWFYRLCTINLSKPEKDPRAIAQAAHSTDKQYPQCALCMENEGYLGRIGHAARSNHRIIRMMIGGKLWGFQYSPYAYFNEHCIFLDAKHEPMKINRQTLVNLVEIEKQFPHYFVGSNADLPIVGGSMLAHEHYQGGRHVFPMMKAPIKEPLSFKDYPTVKAGIVDWPMSDIRLISADDQALVDLGTHIIDNWDQYSDPDLQIRAFSGTTRHHTVTPIMHRDGDQYIIDLVLRDNNTSDQYPLGIFHPHAKLWHIKKENIGLIEVMGRAILPARLQKELGKVKKFWLGQPNEIADSHLEWAKEVQSRRQITSNNVEEVLHEEVAQVFSDVLADAGVFKKDDAGTAGWHRFIQQL